MKIFVTGATGFIGRHVIKEAVANGHTCHCIYRSKIPEEVRNLSGVQWHKGDLASDWKLQFAEIDALIHLAAVGVSPKAASPRAYFHHNVTESITLVSDAIRAGVSNIVACGSCFEYGRSGERYEFIPANAPLEPVNAYGASKAAATIGLCGMAREQHFSLSVIRPFHLYGDGQDESNFWSALKKAALEGRDFEMTPGEQVRDFCDVATVARKFIESLEIPAPTGEPIIANIGSGVPVTLRDFAKSHWRNWNSRGKLNIGAIPYRNDEVMRYVPEIVPPPTERPN